jgi:predicted secreted protein
MFEDNRSKKIMIVAHCILNQNSISDASANLPSQFNEIVGRIMQEKIGILQLPCPELQCLGLDRKDRLGGKRPVLEENTRIRELMIKRDNIKLLEREIKRILFQINEYQKHEFEIKGIIGINRSPSCGVETTTVQNKEVKGKGVFMEMLSEALKKDGQTIKMIGVKTSEIQESIYRLDDLL